MKTVYFNVLPRLSTELFTKKHPKFVLLAKNYFLLAKNLIFKFCLLLSRGITGGMKTIYFNVLFHIRPNYLQKTPIFRFASKNFFSGKEFDFQILLIKLKKHHRRYETRLF